MIELRIGELEIGNKFKLYPASKVYEVTEKSHKNVRGITRVMNKGKETIWTKTLLITRLVYKTN